jgi:hypothetical protein
VNWFRKDENGQFQWPGFGENIRVLKWIVERIRGNASSVESPIGWMPRYEDIDWTGLENFSKEDFANIMTVDREPGNRNYYSRSCLNVCMINCLRIFLYAGIASLLYGVLPNIGITAGEKPTSADYCLPF